MGRRFRHPIHYRPIHHRNTVGLCSSGSSRTQDRSSNTVGICGARTGSTTGFVDTTRARSNNRAIATNTGCRNSAEPDPRKNHGSTHSIPDRGFLSYPAAVLFSGSLHRPNRLQCLLLKARTLQAVYNSRCRTTRQREQPTTAGALEKRFFLSVLRSYSDSTPFSANIQKSHEQAHPHFY